MAIDRRAFTRAASLSPLIGSFSASAGAQVAYTPPAGSIPADVAEVSVFAYVPPALWDQIRRETIPDEVDLDPYLQQAIASGRSLVFPAGTYPFSGTLKPRRGQCLRGAGRGPYGERTLLKAIGNAGPAILLEGGDVTVSALRLMGPTRNAPYRRIGVQVGEDDFSGIYTIREIAVENFDQNIRLRGALWTSFYDVHSLHGTYGLTLDSPPGKYNTTCMFSACSFRENLRQGFVGLNTPVRSVVFNFYGCDFESNGRAGDYPQVQPGALAHTIFSGCYFEDLDGRRDSMRLDSSGGLSIDTCYFNGGRRHIVARAGSSNNIRVCGGTRFLATSAPYAIEMPGCANVVVDPTIETDKPFLLTGPGSGKIVVVPVG